MPRREVKDLLDDAGLWIRPAFADPEGSMTIFQDDVGRRRYVERNGYELDDGIWRSGRPGVPDCRDVIVRAEPGKDHWSVVPEEEAALLRDRVYGAA